MLNFIKEENMFDVTNHKDYKTNSQILVLTHLIPFHNLLNVCSFWGHATTQLVTGFSLQRPRFMHREVYGGTAVNKLAMELDFL
jgi:hypothetical protein